MCVLIPAQRSVQPLGGDQLTLTPDELLVESAALAGYAVAQEGGVQVARHTTLTDDLRREGLARDLVRAVQEARKNAGLALADRIALYLSTRQQITSRFTPPR